MRQNTSFPQLSPYPGQHLDPAKLTGACFIIFFCAGILFSLVVQCFSCMLWKKQNINLKPNAGFAFQDISTLFIFINTYPSESGDVAALLKWIKSHAVHSLSTRFSRSLSRWKPQPCWPHRCILWQFQCFFSPPQRRREIQGLAHSPWWLQCREWCSRKKKENQAESRAPPH